MTRTWLLTVALIVVASSPAEAAEPTPLAKLAASMAPGTWAELKTVGLNNSILRAPQPSKGLEIIGWTDDAHWDDRTRQLLFMGLRQRRRFIAYAEATNAWREIPLPADAAAAGSPPLDSRFGHIYSRNAHDPATGRFYHMDHNAGGGVYRYDLAVDRWTPLPAGGNYHMTGVIEYFAAREGLVNLAADKGLRFFNERTQAWEQLGPCDVHGHHSLGRHNPFRREVLLAGGNESLQTVVRLRADGQIERLRDAPETLTIRHSKITVDPRSGRYLILLTDRRKLYDFDGDKNEYRLVDDFSQTPWPFGHYDQPVAAFIAEHGVTIWAANRVVLYKHGAPAAEPKP